MRNRQGGFTLIEIVIAFTILSMGTVLAVNLVTQSSTRASRVNEHLATMEVLESAIAILHGEIGNRNLRQSYSGDQYGGYRWTASIIGRENPSAAEDKEYLNLYRVTVLVFHDSDTPRLALTTIIPDR